MDGVIFLAALTGLVARVSPARGIDDDLIGEGTGGSSRYTANLMKVGPARGNQDAQVLYLSHSAQLN